MDQENQLSDKEQEVIIAAKQLEVLSRYPGWQRVQKFNEQWIQDALERLEGSVSDDPRVSHALKIRYEERKGYMRLLAKWMNDIIEGRKQIIRELAEANQIAGQQAEDLVEMLDRR